MKKIIRKIKRVFFPRKHSQVVESIARKQLTLRLIQHDLDVYGKMMEHGYLGDRLWENYDVLLSNKNYIKREIKELKTQYFETMNNYL